MTDAEHRPGPLVRALGTVVPGVRRVGGQVTTHAAHWRDHNATIDRRSSRLWVALGDSTAQGIGADEPGDGYVGQLHRRLAAAGIELDVVNLSVSGARTTDVLNDQLPRLHELGAATLVTCSIGANDLLRSARIVRTARRVEEVADRLGATATLAVMATVPVAAISVSGRYVNARLRAAGAAAGVAIAELGRHRGRPYRGKVASDGFHPSAAGYREWADAFEAAIVDAGTLDARR